VDSSEVDERRVSTGVDTSASMSLASLAAVVLARFCLRSALFDLAFLVDEPAILFSLD